MFCFFSTHSVLNLLSDKLEISKGGVAALFITLAAAGANTF